MANEKVISKIQALLRLAQGTPYEEEAKAAMGKVHELLQAHNLSMTNVEIQKDVGDLVSRFSMEFSRPYAWVYNIANAIDLLCNVQHFRSGDGWNWRMCFCGTKTDTSAAESLFSFLYGIIQAMCKAARMPGIRERNSYCNGVGRRVYLRAGALQNKTPPNSEDASRCTALVRLKDQAISLYMKQEWQTKPIHPNTTTGDRDAFHQGMRDGYNVPLSVRKAIAQ